MNLSDESPTAADTRHHLLCCQDVLQAMIGMPANITYVHMLLTGPSGSGKHTVINELLKYAQQYCSFIQQPFMSHTILHTTCSDITQSGTSPPSLHSTFSLHQTARHIGTNVHSNFGDNVKIFIVDEISYLDASTMVALDKRLRFLTKKSSLKFGGVDVVFVGNLFQLHPPGTRFFPPSVCSNLQSCINCYISFNNYQLHPATNNDSVSSDNQGLNNYQLLPDTNNDSVSSDNQDLLSFQHIEEQSRGCLHSHSLVCVQGSCSFLLWCQHCSLLSTNCPCSFPHIAHLLLPISSFDTLYITFSRMSSSTCFLPSPVFKHLS